jgi:2-iminoacetate synthase ThiH
LALDERIHEEVLEAVRSGITEVALWGGTRPAKIGGRVDTTQYRLSAAARAYKRHALAAVGLADREVGHTERLYRSGYRPVDSDLMPVGRSAGAEG